MNKDQNEIANHEQTENIVKRILSSEVKWIIALVIFIVGVVAPYYQIRQDVELIKQNHLAHIEQIEKNVEKMQEQIEEMKKTEVDLLITIAERLPKSK
jgi:uncharacterized membrane-anchored protein YhcB (DUF1043 family)